MRELIKIKIIFLFVLGFLLISSPAFSQSPSPTVSPQALCPPGTAPDPAGHIPSSDGSTNCTDVPKLCGQAVQILPINWGEEELSFDTILEKYSDKFPFAMLIYDAGNTSGGDNQCPVFELSGREMPFCFPIMVKNALYYPALIGWIIWLIGVL